MEAAEVPAEGEGRKIPLVRKVQQESGPRPGDCFVLKAPQLYRDTYSSKPPKPGTIGHLNHGQLTGAREAVHAAVRRGAMRLVDAREEIEVLNAAIEMLGRYGPGTVPVMISTEPFKVREKRKPGSKSKRKRKRR